VTEKEKIEEGTEFVPRFDENGLIPAIAQDIETGQILMLAYMNRESLALTLETGLATYYSRSRGKLWKKGEQSGHVQRIKQILVDCDQDCLVLKVSVDGGQCHVGYQSCFYRSLSTGGVELKFVAEKVYDPNKTYEKKRAGGKNL
jgi:phosphoribosyl-AMP cyclohydrolase